MPTKRIEYIDAMRGLTMLLVVYSHVSCFCLGMTNAPSFSFNDVFTQFRMPLFFFVSGFVFFKVTRTWDKNTTLEFFKKKITVQILSPLIFIILHVLIDKLNLITILELDSKGGYWFTFTLFEYFILYIFLDALMQSLRLSAKAKDIIFIFIGLFLIILSKETFLERLGIDDKIVGLLGLPTLKYFFFFIFGTRVKEYFYNFEEILEKDNTMTFSIVGFVLCEIIIYSMHGLAYSLAYVLAGVFGIIIIFSFFRKHENIVSKQHRLGVVMQYVGRHTLDIYLIHYFFVRYDCTSVLPSFANAHAPFFEFLTSITLSAIVVATCLLISAIISQSNFLAYLLFGQKKK